jgi:hypothetical protein
MDALPVMIALRYLVVCIYPAVTTLMSRGNSHRKCVVNVACQISVCPIYDYKDYEATSELLIVEMWVLTETQLRTDVQS